MIITITGLKTKPQISNFVCSKYLPQVPYKKIGYAVNGHGLLSQVMAGRNPCPRVPAFLFLGSFAKNRGVHPIHYAGGVLFRKVGVPLHHGQRLVPQNGSDFLETRAVHGQVAGGGMP